MEFQDIKEKELAVITQVGEKFKTELKGNEYTEYDAISGRLTITKFEDRWFSVV